MKKTYIIPALEIVSTTACNPLAQSNRVSSDGKVNLNSATMDAGNGSDAVKANNYNVWNDDWK